MKLTKRCSLRSLLVLGAAAAVTTAGSATVVGGGVAAAKGSKSPFVFVVPSPSSGALASFLGSQGPVAQAAAKVLNAHGGIDGHKVVITVIDTASTVSAGASKLAARLNSSPTPNVVVPGGISTQGVAYVPLANQHHILSIGEPNATTLNAPSKYPYEFEVAGSEKEPAKQFANYAKSKGWKNVAVLASTDPYGKSVGDDISSALSAAGIKTERATFNTTQLTMTPQLEQLKAATPTALYINSETATIKYILNDRYKLGWQTVPAVGDLTVAVTGYAESLAGTPTDKNVLVQATTPVKYTLHPTKAFQQFVSAMKAAGVIQVSLGATYLDYDTFMVVAAAAAQAHAVTTPKMTKALEHLKTPKSPLWVGFKSAKYSHTTHTVTLPLSAWIELPISDQITGQLDAPGAKVSTAKA